MSSPISYEAIAAWREARRANRYNHILVPDAREFQEVIESLKLAEALNSKDRDRWLAENPMPAEPELPAQPEMSKKEPIHSKRGYSIGDAVSVDCTCGRSWSRAILAEACRLRGHREIVKPPKPQAKPVEAFVPHPGVSHPREIVDCS